MSVEWGTVGEWVGGLGSLGAATVALVLAGRTMSADRRRFARLVAILPEVMGSPEEPIQTVLVSNESGGTLRKVHTLGEVTDSRVIARNLFALQLAPGKSVRLGTPPDWEHTVRFVDPNGVTWSIDTRRHQLTEVKPPRSRSGRFLRPKR